VYPHQFGICTIVYMQVVLVDVNDFFFQLY